MFRLLASEGESLFDDLNPPEELSLLESQSTLIRTDGVRSPRPFELKWSLLAAIIFCPRSWLKCEVRCRRRSVLCAGICSTSASDSAVNDGSYTCKRRMGDELSGSTIAVSAISRLTIKAPGIPAQRRFGVNSARSMVRNHSQVAA